MKNLFKSASVQNHANFIFKEIPKGASPKASKEEVMEYFGNLALPRTSLGLLELDAEILKDSASKKEKITQEKGNLYGALCKLLIGEPFLKVNKNKKQRKIIYQAIKILEKNGLKVNIFDLGDEVGLEDNKIVVYRKNGKVEKYVFESVANEKEDTIAAKEVPIPEVEDNEKVSDNTSEDFKIKEIKPITLDATLKPDSPYLPKSLAESLNEKYPLKTKEIPRKKETIEENEDENFDLEDEELEINIKENKETQDGGLDSTSVEGQFEMTAKENSKDNFKLDLTPKTILLNDLYDVNDVVKTESIKAQKRLVKYRSMLVEAKNNLSKLRKQPNIDELKDLEQSLKEKITWLKEKIKKDEYYKKVSIRTISKHNKQIAELEAEGVSLKPKKLIIEYGSNNDRSKNAIPDTETNKKSTEEPITVVLETEGEDQDEESTTKEDSIFEDKNDEETDIKQRTPYELTPLKAKSA